ncbi:MAG TPA: LPXTG cell wall anchor domain-containing protein [Candidatus Levilactobacillus faecigallinarum]|uniref:LPXTG cell wall anchor domain-containing protein n=1 Tax=Candidatus Levilactobacillus faecigallinarum TaxID=2838638 RepID=A0A9D1U4X7_9LACO|nr:LPXTG cell wall anchor domain-containing protein [Candidatus Levilactobacillus faecigallinarum]
MWRKIGWLLIPLAATIIIFLGNSVVRADNTASSNGTTNIDSHITGLSAPSSIGLLHDDKETPIEDINAPLKKGDQYKLHYAFSIDDDSNAFKLKAGDTATVTLPKTSLYSGNATGTIVQKGTGAVIGTIAITGATNTGVITFTDALTSMTSRSATFEILTSGSYDAGGTSTDSTARAISKVGWVSDNDRDANGVPTKITWNISINNEGKDYGNTTVVDYLGEDQEYINDSVNMVTAGDQKPTVTVEGQKITFRFLNVKKTTAFTYQTTPGDLTGKDTATFTNRADLTADNGTTGAVGNDGTTTNKTPVEVNSSYTWQRPGGVGDGQYSAQLTKTDNGKTPVPLEGAEYTLKQYTDSNYTASTATIIGTQKTDNKGQVLFKDLTAGYYAFSETTPPTGYKLNSELVKFEIKKANMTVSQTDEPKDATGNITLTKVDKSDATKVLSGAVFDLQRKDADGHYVDNKTGLTTDEKGQIHVDNLSVGDYRFVEKTAPNGYSLNQDTPQVVTVTKDATTSVTVQDARKPEEDKGSITLTKEDAANSATRLKDAVFDLQEKGTDGAYTNVKGKTSLNTDEKGQIHVTNLPAGTYRFVEVKAPKGYEKDSSAPQEIVVAKDTEATVTVKDVKTIDKGSITLIKTDATDTATKLAGAVFDLQLENTDGSYSNVTDKTGLTTDTQGQIHVTNLPVGNYRFVEVKAPAGYQLAQPTEAFKVGTDATTMVTVKDAKTITPPIKKPGQVMLTKVDAVDINTVLSGATFTLQQKNTDGSYSDVSKATKLTTDDRGQIYVGDLAVGEYRFVEITPPAGYDLNNQAATFTVKVDATAVQTVMFKDQQTPTTPITPTTPTNPTNNGSSSSGSNGSSSLSSSSSSSSLNETSSSSTPAAGGSGENNATGNGQSDTPVSSTQRVMTSQQANTPTATAKRHATVGRLPQTSEQKMAGMIIFGLVLLVGGTLSYTAWRRNRSKN